MNPVDQRHHRLRGAPCVRVLQSRFEEPLAEHPLGRPVKSKVSLGHRRAVLCPLVHRGGQAGHLIQLAEQREDPLDHALARELGELAHPALQPLGEHRGEQLVLAGEIPVDGAAGQAFGGAAIAMNSKQLGADYVLAWPDAEIGVMAARQAVEIIHRREIASAGDPEAAASELSGRYAADHLSLRAAAAEGFIDEVIAPERTRSRIIAALASLDGREPTMVRHGNVQL